MKIVEQNLPFLLFDVTIHTQIKPSIMSAIDGMGLYSFIDNRQCIAHTDWHLNSDFSRPYYELVAPVITDVIDKVNTVYEYPEPLTLINYWFQKYLKDDYHEWHIHQKSVFNAVYFLSLPEESSKTSFKLFGKEFSVDVKEGQVLVFPSMCLHCSKPNKSNDPKIVIAFNL